MGVSVLKLPLINEIFADHRTCSLCSRQVGQTILDGTVIKNVVLVHDESFIWVDVMFIDLGRNEYRCWFNTPILDIEEAFPTWAIPLNIAEHEKIELQSLVPLHVFLSSTVDDWKLLLWMKTVLLIFSKRRQCSSRICISYGMRWKVDWTGSSSPTYSFAYCMHMLLPIYLLYY